MNTHLKLKTYQAKAAAGEVTHHIADLIEVQSRYFDGRHVYLRALPTLDLDEKALEARIRELDYDPTIYRENGLLQIYFPLKKRRTQRPAWVMNIILFILTVGTTFANGMIMSQKGMSIWWSGFLFSSSLLAILAAHEFGHYFLALFHRMKATLPYFIPAPPFPITPIGTFGAFIKMKSPIPSRVALFDVGIGGPLAGFAVALPLTILGIMNSVVVPELEIGGGAFILGDSLLFKGLTIMFGPPVPAGADVLLHPVAYAGWIGLLVTAINLLPIGQLDGGHIIYAMFPRLHSYIARFFFITLVGVGFFYFQGWLVWAVLILFLIRLDHPPTQEDRMTLDTSRMMLGYMAIILFIMTFVPVPMEIVF